MFGRAVAFHRRPSRDTRQAISLACASILYQRGPTKCVVASFRPASGISDEQSRKTSPVQSRRWSSCVKAWRQHRQAESQARNDFEIPDLQQINAHCCPQKSFDITAIPSASPALESIMIVLRRGPTLQAC
jgi:hypothetical protein